MKRMVDLTLLPAKINTSNIQTLTTDEINNLECGDIVCKLTGNQKHAYIVSYKEDKQGICLTYTDASCVETVSYDYIDSEWVYNSTDITHLEPLGDLGIDDEENLKITNNINLDNNEITDVNILKFHDGSFMNTAPHLYKYAISCYDSNDDTGNLYTFFVLSSEQIDTSLTKFKDIKKYVSIGDLIQDGSFQDIFTKFGFFIDEKQFSYVEDDSGILFNDNMFSDNNLIESINFIKQIF